MLPSIIASSTPVTVTVWFSSQLSVVKVSSPGETAPSVTSLEVTLIFTVVVGLEFNLTWKVVETSGSAVVNVVVDETIPAISLSILVALTNAVLPR